MVIPNMTEGDSLKIVTAGDARLHCSSNWTDSGRFHGLSTAVIHRTWVGLDADTKLVASWYVGSRDSEAAMMFMDDLAPRLTSRVQLTSDGHKPYLEAIEGAFGGDIDYAMLVKIYGAAPEGQRRYSPAICTGARKFRVEGNPDSKHVSTSFVERSNLSMRMGNRRMTRLTNAFSKKAQNHAHMMAIYFMHYNFVRIHQTLKVTPAMAAGVTSKLWEMVDMVKVLEDWEAKVVA